MKTFSLMWTEKLGQAMNKATREPYPMEFHRGKELDAICCAINQGIDSYLQAVHFTQGRGEHGRMKIIVEPQSVSVLVRRLLESGNEDAEMLASDICGTIGIELI